VAADGIVEIEVILEDGSAQKGFLRLKKQAEDFKKTAEGSVGKGTEKATEDAGNALNSLGSRFGQVASAARAVAIPVGAAAAAIGGLFAATNASSKIVDELKAINSQFDNLAARGGASANVLRESFAETARGLVNLDDVIKSSNLTLGSLEISASTLAKNFEIARQASVAFGVDTVQAYEALNQAIITGNTRSLRQLGLFIDSKEAIDNYAKSLGVAAQFLSDTGRQQAIANAIAEKSATVFEGVNTATEKNSDATKRLSVSYGQLKDAAAAYIDATIGPAAAASNNFLAQAADRLALLLKPAANTPEQQLKDIRSQIQFMDQDLQFLIDRQRTFAAQPFDKEKIAQYRAEIQSLREEEEKLGMAQMKRSQASANATRDELRDNQNLLLQQQALFAQQQQLAQQRNMMDRANAENRMATAQTEEEFNRAKADALMAETMQYEFQKDAIKKQYAAAGLAGRQAELDALAALEEQHSARVVAIAQKENASMVKLRGIVQAGIVNGLTNAFAGLGKALVKGQNGFEAMGKAVLGALGAMAIQIGTMMVMIGLSFKALGPVLPVFGLSGAAAVAAGLGLIVLGGALSAMGEGGETAAGTASAGGGVSGNGGTANLGGAADGSQLEDVKPGTQIAVHINGNVWDRRATGLEIVSVIQEHFDTNGGQTLVGVT